MKVNVEFKIKDDTIRWEDNEPYVIKSYEVEKKEDTNILARKDAKEIANKLNKEVRWVQEGYMNGNYVLPDFR